MTGGESGIRTHGTCEGTHTFQACAENLELIKQYLFNIETSKIGLDCDQSESRFFWISCRIKPRTTILKSFFIKVL